MAGYVNNSAPITDRALSIARDSIPDHYLGQYLFYRDSVPRTGQTESYTIVFADNLVHTETGFSAVIDQGTSLLGHRVTFVEFGFLEVPQNAPEGTLGVCQWRYIDSNTSSYVQWPVQSQAGTLLYGSLDDLPHLVESGGDPYVFAGLLIACCCIVYYLFYSIWHHWILR